MRSAKSDGAPHPKELYPASERKNFTAPQRVILARVERDNVWSEIWNMLHDRPRRMELFNIIILRVLDAYQRVQDFHRPIWDMNRKDATEHLLANPPVTTWRDVAFYAQSTIEKAASFRRVAGTDAAVLDAAIKANTDLVAVARRRHQGLVEFDRTWSSIYPKEPRIKTDAGRRAFFSRALSRWFKAELGSVHYKIVASLANIAFPKLPMATSDTVKMAARRK